MGKIDIFNNVKEQSKNNINIDNLLTVYKKYGKSKDKNILNELKNRKVYLAKEYKKIEREINNIKIEIDNIISKTNSLITKNKEKKKYLKELILKKV